MTPWKDLQAASAYTGCAAITLLRAVRAGQLRAYKVSGKKLWRFHTSDLDRWLSASPQGATA